MRKKLLCILAILTTAAQAQSTNDLRVVVVGGESAFNNIREKVASVPVVQVTDFQDHPIEGARVTFALPPSGPSGSFLGGGRTFTMTSDSKGIAMGSGFRPNDVEGRFEIAVTASLGERKGAATLRQSNTLAGGVSSQKKGKGKYIVLGIIAAGAAGILVAKGTSGGSASPPVAPTVLTVGPVIVGAPH